MHMALAFGAGYSSLYCFLGVSYYEVGVYGLDDGGRLMEEVHRVLGYVHGVYLFVHGVLMGEVAAVAEGIVLRADVLYGVGDRESSLVLRVIVHNYLCLWRGIHMKGLWILITAL